MRIGVFEWICSGGSNVAPGVIFPASVRAEGWAMCRAMMLDILQSGGSVAVVLAIDAVPDSALESLVAEWPPARLSVTRLAPEQSAKAVWQATYKACRSVVVVAPESGRVLATVLDDFSSFQVATINCSGAFLDNASDKWLTAGLLAESKIPHPPTQLLSALAPQWLDEHATPSDTWALKTRDGVGCDGLQRLPRAALLRFQTDSLQTGHVRLETAGNGFNEQGQRESDRWIVQPWLAGEACSCAAIVDVAGKCHWMPRTQQSISLSPQVVYSGGAVDLNLIQGILFRSRNATRGCTNLPALARQFEEELNGLLDATVRSLGNGALGWIGIDFLVHLDNPKRPFTIIEVNPRMTTSFVGLSASVGGGLIDRMSSASTAPLESLPKSWRPIRFRADGSLV